jgi:hypothetical protein
VRKIVVAIFRVWGLSVVSTNLAVVIFRMEIIRRGLLKFYNVSAKLSSPHCRRRLQCWYIGKLSTCWAVCSESRSYALRNSRYKTCILTRYCFIAWEKLNVDNKSFIMLGVKHPMSCNWICLYEITIISLVINWN